MSPVRPAPDAAALRRLAAGRALLAFDLDGTLAPLVPCRDEAAVPPAISAHLQALALAWPIAVITGRRVEDARQRLGFAPRYLVGNHGAEWPGRRGPAVLKQALDPCRQWLQRHADALLAHGVELEDKGLSLALHHAGAADPERAHAWLETLRLAWHGTVRCSHGHRVLNVTVASAPHKGDALLALMQACGADIALIVGDDSNDEAAVASAPPGSVSVRIGPRGVSSCAGYQLASQDQVEPLLGRLRRLPNPLPTGVRAEPKGES